MDYTSPAELEAWLEQLDSLAVANRYPAPRFIKPFHLATLAHKLRLAALTEFRIPDKLASYANTMQLNPKASTPSAASTSASVLMPVDRITRWATCAISRRNGALVISPDETLMVVKPKRFVSKCRLAVSNGVDRNSIRLASACAIRIS